MSVYQLSTRLVTVLHVTYITVSPVICNCLNTVFCTNMMIYCLQTRFSLDSKKQHSCSYVFFVLNQVVNVVHWLSLLWLFTVFAVMFEMLMMMNGCIYAQHIVMRRRITFWWLGNYVAKVSKIHTVEGGGYFGLWHIFDRGFSHVWHFVAEGREGVKFGRKSVTYFWMAPSRSAAL